MQLSPAGAPAVAIVVAAAMITAYPSDAQAQRAPISASPVAAKTRTLPARLIVLQVSDEATRGAGGVRRLELTLALDGRGSARIITRAGSSQYEVAVHEEAHRRSTSGSPVYRIEVHRKTRGGSGDFRMEMSRRLVRGEQALVGRLQRPDGSKTSLHATLR